MKICKFLPVVSLLLFSAVSYAANAPKSAPPGVSAKSAPSPAPKIEKPQTPCTIIKVNGLHELAQDQELLGMCMPNCDKATVMVDRQTGRGKGQGIVFAKDSDNGHVAVSKLNGAAIRGKVLSAACQQ